MFHGTTLIKRSRLGPCFQATIPDLLSREEKENEHELRKKEFNKRLIYDGRKNHSLKKTKVKSTKKRDRNELELNTNKNCMHTHLKMEENPHKKRKTIVMKIDQLSNESKNNLLKSMLISMPMQSQTLPKLKGIANEEKFIVNIKNSAMETIVDSSTILPLVCILFLCFCFIHFFYTFVFQLKLKNEKKEIHSCVISESMNNSMLKKTVKNECMVNGITMKSCSESELHADRIVNDESKQTSNCLVLQLPLPLTNIAFK